MRTSVKQLETYVKRINAELGLTRNFGNDDKAYSLDYNPSYGGYRLERNKGSVDVSERLSAGEMRQFLLGMIECFSGFNLI